MTNRKPILLTSLPRSGSTWAGKILGSAEGVFLVIEPDHLGVWGIGQNGMHPYIPLGADNEKYYKIFYKAFRGRTYRPLSLKKSYISYVKRQLKSYSSKFDKVLVKTVYSLPNTLWLYKRFEPLVVVLLRNPYSLIHSIHRKWPDARLKALHNQPALMNDFLAPYKKILLGAKTPCEILAANVGAYYKIILQMAYENPTWIIITHEELCEDTKSTFERLYQKLDLKWSDRIQQLIEQTNKPKKNDLVAHVCRISKYEPEKWRKLLTEEEIEQIRYFYTPFKNQYYDNM